MNALEDDSYVTPGLEIPMGLEVGRVLGERNIGFGEIAVSDILGHFGHLRLAQPNSLCDLLPTRR